MRVSHAKCVTRGRSVVLSYRSVNSRIFPYHSVNSAMFSSYSVRYKILTVFLVLELPLIVNICGFYNKKQILKIGQV